MAPRLLNRTPPPPPPPPSRPRAFGAWDFGSRVCCHMAQAVKVGMQTSFESFVKCTEQLWPECGGPSNTDIPVSAGKTTPTLRFRPRGLGLNLARLPTTVLTLGVPGNWFFVSVGKSPCQMLQSENHVFCCELSFLLDSCPGAQDRLAPELLRLNSEALYRLFYYFLKNPKRIKQKNESLDYPE